MNTACEIYENLGGKETFLAHCNIVELDSYYDMAELYSFLYRL